MFPKRIVLLAGAAVTGLFIVASIFMSVVTVDKGHVGVVTHWGAVQPKELSPGLHFVMPWMTGVTEMSTKLSSFDVVNEQAASKDLQTVTTTISVQHELVGAMAPKALDNVGTIEDIDGTVVDPAVQESLKAVTARYTAEEMVTLRDKVKAEVTQEIKDYINSTLREKGIEGTLRIANVAIEDFQFSKEFNDSIEAKVKAEQDALKAENNKQKRITDAEAAYEQRKLNADAEAYQIEQASIARANAIKREAKALEGNPELIRLRAAEKWSGKLPVYSGGGGQAPVPFVNVDQNKTDGGGK